MVAVRIGSQLGSLGRIVWMMVGPACLLVGVVLIINSPGAGWFTGPDIVCWAALAAMMLGRWTEHRSGDARNGLGEPSAPNELTRYMAVVAIVGPLIWMIANLVSNVLLA